MMKWKYYNHAAVPTTAPHEEVDLTPINDGSIWKMNGKPLLARWTSEFDCGYVTNWWYVIKDTAFDISALKAKRRYEINKGKKNYRVKRINPQDFSEELFFVTVAAYSQWPEKYRPHTEKESFIKSVANWERYVVLAGFEVESEQLCGYALLQEHECHVDFVSLRVTPESEKKGINAAMVAGVLDEYSSRLGSNYYICDGARSIRHETAFQDYLEKYFEFRKAYCKLNIRYRFPIGIVVKLLYPFRNKINNNSGVGSQIIGVLRMEEICRSCK